MVKQYTLETFSDLAKGKKLYLYGAGKRGRMWHRTYTHCGFEISGFIDVKQKGDDIFHPDFLKTLPSKKDILVCISTIDMHVKEIAKKLEEYGFERDVNYINASQTCHAYPTIEVSGLCNLRCMSCNLGSHVDGRKGGIMPYSKYCEILDKLTSEVPIMPFLSLFLWGDPSLNPELPEIIRKSNASGISVDVSTNLNFDRRLEEVVAAAPACLAIPCSGIGKNYEFTHTGGKWEVFEKNLRRVREYMDKYNADIDVQVSYHLYKHNLEKDYDYVKSLVDELGFSFKPVIAVLFPESIFESVAYGKEIPEKMRLISEHMLYSIKEQTKYSEQKSDCKNVCKKVFPTIRWDGSVVACYNMEGGKIADNFLDVSLAELQRRRDNSKLCMDCKKFNMQQLFFPDDKKELLRAAKKRGQELQKKEILERGEVC